MISMLKVTRRYSGSMTGQTLSAVTRCALCGSSLTWARHLQQLCTI